MDAKQSDPQQHMVWDQYVVAHPEHRDVKPVIEQFGDSAAMADELAALVLHGPKRATAGLVDDYVLDDEPLPLVGEHWVIIDGQGVQQVVVRTTEVRVGSLDSVDDSFAWDEGEGDRTRDSWLAEHRAFAKRRCATQGLEIPAGGVDAMDAVFQRFEKVWPAPDTD